MSRNKRRALIGMGVLLVFGVSMLDRWGGDGLREVVTRGRPEGADAEKYHRKSFAVNEIIDGDTVDIDVPDGKWPDTRVRLLGVDTPETKSPRYGEMYYGPEATEFTRQLVAGKEVTVIIDTVSDVRDRYGRLLAYLELEDGRVLNAELVRKGFAYADLRFSHSRYEEYENLMIEAVKEGHGLWEEVERDELPQWLRREWPGILKLREKAVK
ncbi:Thermonuclease precursor [Anaerohalosphaera lusitana]|uniref:Thermonuclease n=1 Tax=Anaerohalosphaera lusitana TaxID=1936003 RepID=A0A1U9NL48_9BACT|nr:thermonuclease family protein [Anaerohalosphaera lusitana]AQT68663.1 Thermonuclease precursor [Anaerohalosphaera lusitana]